MCVVLVFELREFFFEEVMKKFDEVDWVLDEDSFFYLVDLYREFIFVNNWRNFLKWEKIVLYFKRLCNYYRRVRL